MRLQPADVDQAFVEQRVDQRHQPIRIGAGHDRKMFRRVLRRLRATRVHHHERAPFAYRFESAGHVGRREQAAVRHVRVRAEHQQVVGAVEIRQREHVGPAPHQAGADVLRHLIDRRRREDVGACHRGHHRADIELSAEIVRVRVAEHRAERLATMRLDDRSEPTFDLGKGLVPGCFLPTILRANTR